MGVDSQGVGKRARTAATPTAAPMTWARTKPGAEPGAIPAKVSEKMRPMVTAGFAKEVELVN